MKEFIQRNKIFAGCLAFLLAILVGLIGYTIVLTTKENIEIFPPNQSNKDVQISMFRGEFDEEMSAVQLTWDYQMYDHELEKIELYRNEECIATFPHEKEVQLSIYEYALSTGANEFELRLYYDKGKMISRKAEVQISYIFHVEMKHQLVDNNLGDGYLFSIRYQYNAKTPVGIPKIYIESSYLQWDAKYIGRTSKTLEEDYQEIEAYYLVKMDPVPNEVIEWKLTYTFNSVGAQFVDHIQENPYLQEKNQQVMKISK